MSVSEDIKHTPRNNKKKQRRNILLLLSLFLLLLVLAGLLIGSSYSGTMKPQITPTLQVTKYKLCLRFLVA